MSGKSSCGTAGELHIYSVVLCSCWKWLLGHSRWFTCSSVSIVNILFSLLASLWSFLWSSCVVQSKKRRKKCFTFLLFNLKDDWQIKYPFGSWGCWWCPYELHHKSDCIYRDCKWKMDAATVMSFLQFCSEASSSVFLLMWVFWMRL